MQRQNSTDNYLNMSEKVGLPEENPGYTNINSFPDSKRQNNHPHIEQKSCLKKKQQGCVNIEKILKKMT